MTNIRQSVAKDLLEIKAVELRPNDYFIWKIFSKVDAAKDNRMFIF